MYIEFAPAFPSSLKARRLESVVAKGINTVIIWTEALERLLPFYRDAIGLRLQFESPEFVTFEAEGGARLGLGKHSDVTGKSKDPNRIMLNFMVDDCKAEAERLKAKGVEFTRDPSPEPDGMLMATFLDPDGNTLQLIQQPH